MAAEHERGFDDRIGLRKAVVGSPAFEPRSKVRLSPSSGWITGVAASSAVSGSVTPVSNSS
jgi:hypothetical protein